MKKFFRYYDKMEEVVLVFSLVVTVAIITMQIIFRYVLNASLSWSEELTRYIFIWQIWLGTSYGMSGDQHLKVTVLYDHCPEKVKKLIKLAANLILLSFCIFLIFNGSKMVMQLFNRHTLSTVLRLPMYLVYIALPFSSLMVGLRLISQTVDLFRRPAEELPTLEGGK